MSLDVSKLLSQCKNYRQEDQIEKKKHWSSAKSFKFETKSLTNFKSVSLYKIHNKIFNSTNESQHEEKNIKAAINKKNARPLCALKYFGVTNGKMGILTKKMNIPYPNEKIHYQQLDISIENKKIHHLYAIPRKILTPVKNCNFNSKTKIIVKEKPKNKICFIKKIEKKTEKINKIQEKLSIKKVNSLETLQKNDYFNEPYLKTFSNKHTSDQN